MSGATPVIAAIFKITWEAIQPNTPAAISLNLISARRDATLRIDNRSAVNNTKINNNPTNPSVSPITAKIESLIASGKYPVA